jgi:hypothetical protein
MVKAAKYGLSFKDLDLVATKASKIVKRTYSFMGCFTIEDLHSISWSGILAAITQPKFDNATNKLAYCFTFAKGYCTHALQRKSRMVRVPYSVLKSSPSGTAHLSYSWDNLPEPSAELESSTYPVELLMLADAIPESDKTRILKGEEIKSPKTIKLLNQIKELASVL